MRANRFNLYSNHSGHDLIRRDLDSRMMADSAAYSVNQLPQQFSGMNAMTSLPSSISMPTPSTLNSNSLRHQPTAHSSSSLPTDSTYLPLVCDFTVI